MFQLGDDMTDDVSNSTSGQDVSSSAVPRRDASFSGAILVALLCASLMINIALSRRISSIKHSLEQQTQQHLLLPGTRVPPLYGKGVTGGPQVVTYDRVNVPTLIYLFTPQCGWCRKNLPNLHALAEHSGPNYRLVGVSLTSKDLSDYLQREHLSDLPVLTDPSEATTSAFRFGGTPETILISPAGDVEKVWVGVYQGHVKSEIENSLNLQLPGCCNVSGN
jgi:thiol-disulfide isomerase/thioredoxin